MVIKTDEADTGGCVVPMISVML
jgi:hypothetical protein